jgi:hypothetical protein
MSSSMKKVVINTLFLTSFAAAITSTHFFVVKPVFDEAAFKIRVAEETSNLFRPALDGDAKAIEGLERFAQEGSMLSYLFLNAIYDKQAIKAAGIDIKEPNPNFESVDFTKSSNLILQAVHQLDDDDLLYVLSGMRGKFDPIRQSELLAETPGDNTRSKNISKSETFSTFDQQTKDRLLACHQKLKKKLPNRFYRMWYVNARGACLDNPTDPTPGKSTAIASDLVSPTVSIKAEDTK